MKPKTLRIVKILAGIVLIALCLLSLDSGAQAIPLDSEQQEVQLNYQGQQKLDTPSVFWMVVQTILALCFVLILAWGIFRLFGRNLRSRMQGRYMRVLDEIGLGPNRGIVVIEIGGKAFIIGITDHQISMLGELTDARVIEDMIMTSMEDTHVSSVTPANAWKYIKEKLGVMPVEKQAPRFDTMVDWKIQALERMSHRLRNLDKGSLRDDEDNR